MKLQPANSFYTPTRREEDASAAGAAWTPTADSVYLTEQDGDLTINLFTAKPLAAVWLQKTNDPRLDIAQFCGFGELLSFLHMMKHAGCKGVIVDELYGERDVQRINIDDFVAELSKFGSPDNH